MTLTNHSQHYKKRILFLFMQLNRCCGVFDKNRVFTVVLSLLFLSACNQQDPPASLNGSINLSKTDPESSKTYGRQAVFDYPDFAGKFAVASHSMVISDLSRIEPFDKNSIENRKLQIRFYYPAKAFNKDQPAPTRLPVISKDTWEYLVGPHERAGKMLRFDNYRTAKWNISLNSQVAESQPSYPVLIFSHGYGYSAESYSALSAELASKGYIVVSINHTYGANYSDFGNNDLVWAEPLPSDEIGAYLPIWSDDQIFVINQLSLINGDTNSLFYNKLDLVNLGVFGHSYGGAAAYLTASRDPQVKAVIDIDGTIFDFKNHYIAQPFAFILSKDHRPKFDYTNAGNDAYEITLTSFTHVSFTDHPLWWQWDHDDEDLGLGQIDAHRAVELTTEIVSDFFAKYITSQTSKWFENNQILTSEVALVKKN